jgi:thiamine biosynthesis lipoprotein
MCTPISTQSSCSSVIASAYDHVVSHSGAGRSYRLSRKRDFWQGFFHAMGSPCELLTEVDDEVSARQLLDTVAAEAWRVEDKFSRYIPGNIVAQINNSDGCSIEVDDETADLLDFAATLNRLSDGLFDITSGVLGEVWTFDGSENIPSADQVKSVLRCVGWQKLSWDRPQLTLAHGMRIDLGGLGKEYAVDKAAGLIASHTDASCLVNFGGDLFATGAPSDPSGWQVGVEGPERGPDKAEHLIRLKRGGLATSGDARRYLLKDGVRYSHILNPLTGWPIEHAPRSITVAADTCTQAGMLATLASLHGKRAESCLDEQDVQYWCLR